MVSLAEPPPSTYDLHLDLSFLVRRMLAAKSAVLGKLQLLGVCLLVLCRGVVLRPLTSVSDLYAVACFIDHTISEDDFVIAFPLLVLGRANHAAVIGASLDASGCIRISDDIPMTDTWEPCRQVR